MPVVDGPFDAPDDHLLEYESSYPDVVAAGSLVAALQAEADRAGHRFTAEPVDVPGLRRVAAEVTDGFRSTRVLMGYNDRNYLGPGSSRSFGVTCWAGRVQMASGRTPELPEAAAVAYSWLQAPRVRVLVAQWPFLDTCQLAEAYERGEAIPVLWHRLRARAAEDPRLRDLVEAAYEQPRL